MEVFLAGDSSKGLAARCVDVGWLVIRPGVEDSSKGPKSAEVHLCVPMGRARAL